VGKNKGKSKRLVRRATFVRGKHLDVDKTGAPTRTLNAVQRAALNANAPTMRAAQIGGKPTVFFKAHSDEDAASQYAVASTRLARFLKMDELISHNAFAKVHNVRGAVSGAVPGAPLFSVEKNLEVHRPPEYDKSETPMWVKNKQLEERDGKFYDVSKKIFQWVDYKNARIQKGMSDLQLFDALTGQMDRHAGNIFVDPTTGEVSGIDDDKSFGKGRTAADQGVVPYHGYYKGLPALVDEDTARKILAVSPTDLPEILAAADTDSVPLTDAEIAEAVRRFEGVRQYVRDLQKRGALIGQNGTTWDDATYQQALADPTHSYLGYQAAGLQDAVQQATAGDQMYEILGAPPTVPAPPPVPVGLDFAQILQGQQAPGNVPPTTINQPQATGLLPPTQRGPIGPFVPDASRAARTRLNATRPRLLLGARPTRQGAADADTTSSEEDDNSTSE